MQGTVCRVVEAVGHGASYSVCKQVPWTTEMLLLVFGSAACGSCPNPPARTVGHDNVEAKE